MDPAQPEQPKAPCKPHMLAMVICDAIWHDPYTGKRTMLGLFSGIGARTFPAAQPIISVYVAMTEIYGKIPIRLRLIDADEERPPLTELRGEIESSEVLAVAELDWQIEGIVFPEPGEYRFQLFCGSEPLMERRIVVADFSQGGEQ